MVFIENPRGESGPSKSVSGHQIVGTRSNAQKGRKGQSQQDTDDDDDDRQFEKGEPVVAHPRSTGQRMPTSGT